MLLPFAEDPSGRDRGLHYPEIVMSKLAMSVIIPIEYYFNFFLSESSKVL